MALALILISAGTTLAQHPKEMGAPMPGMMPPGHPPMGMAMDDDEDGMKHCMMGIGFTDEQQAKLDKMRLEGQRTQVEKKAQMADLQAKLKLAMTAEKFSQKEIDDVAAKMGKFHQEAILMKAKHVREVREMLTAEQRIKFDQSILDGKMGPGGRSPGFGMGHGMGKGHDCGSGCDDDDDDCDHKKKKGGKDCD